jgi:uncharacterized membrane protein YdjX (TVP38/TMEM64 family)
MSTLFRRLLFSALIVALLAIVAVVASRHASFDWFVENDRWLRAVIQKKPVTCGFVAFAVYLAASLVPGLGGKSVILGWLFGLVVGVIIVNTALVAAALVTFLLCRHYLKAAVQSRFGFYLRPIQKQINRDGTMYLLTLRLAHAPFSFMNYAVGAGTDVPLRTFWWTTQVGLLPGNLVFVYAGTRLPTLEQLVVSGPLGLLDAPMIAALSGTMFVPWLLRKLIRLFSLTSGPAQKLPPTMTEVHAEKDS